MSELEILRAAVAEAGYDPDAVYADHKGRCWITVESLTEPKVPVYVAWKVNAVTHKGKVRCFECSVHNVDGNNNGDICMGVGMIMDDCGADRSHLKRMHNA